MNTALGYSGNDKVKVLYSAPDENDNIDQQVNILDEELARYPDVIRNFQCRCKRMLRPV